MGRQEAVARSIVLCIIGSFQNRANGGLSYVLSLFSVFFSLFQLPFQKIRPADFSNLRRNHWNLDDNAYLDSFRTGDGKKAEEALIPIGDMGYSGSTFYATADEKFLVKSVPRHSEHSFFRDDLLTPYVEYMATHPKSLLVRISDFIGSQQISLGRMLRLVPSHHIVMENIMYGQKEAKQKGDMEWEQWDLKPTSYFYPERDIAGGALTSEATKDHLADEFPDKIILSRQHADELFASLETDTALLADYNAVDYSLFLVRIQSQNEAPGRVTDPDQQTSADSIIPQDPPAAPPEPPSWRTGVPSSDGKHIFRAAVLDFFWAKHKVQPKVMTFLVNTWNLLIHHHGPMSITTTPQEYRQRFLKMCREYVEVKEGDDA